MNKKHLIILFILIFSLIAFLFTHNNKKTTLAPDIHLTTITNKKISLRQLEGKTVIVTFWATDCPACIEEIPHLIDLYNQYHQNGLEIIAIAMYYDPPSHVVSMSKAKQIPYDVSLDLKAAYAKAFGHIQLTPTTLLISPAGIIIQQITGKFDIDKMKQKLNYLTKG